MLLRRTTRALPQRHTAGGHWPLASLRRSSGAARHGYGGRHLLHTSTSTTPLVKAEGVVTGFKFVYEAPMEGRYVEEVKVAVNCVGYALATASSPSPSLATLNNGAYFNATFVTGIPHCSDA